MSSPPPSYIQCPNPACLHPENLLGQLVCDRCQAPLLYRYLWAVGADLRQVPIGTHVENRYRVLAPQIWLDLQPGQAPEIPTEWASTELANWVMPYLRLYPYRLHLPVVHGFCKADTRTVALLDNVPLSRAGKPYPSLRSQWPHASAVRQTYWLWQLLQLWVPLQDAGVASSLLIDENIRVEGWRVRLLQLRAGKPKPSGKPEGDTPLKLASLQDLATVWQPLVNQANPQIAPALQALCQQMVAENTDNVLDAIAAQLNQILLEQAAQLPLYVQIAGATSTGPQRAHNEDACYPANTQGQADPALPYLGIVCDGIGGHAGGEVASHLALKSLELQVRALLVEVEEQAELLPPDVVAQQLEAVVRVVNNMISNQNDTQGRAARQRMGTTLAMALQLPQTVTTASGRRNAHELYLAHVGDSRAYWITPHYCQLLTVDDDVATRDVRTGRSLYQEAVRRPDSGALTQALGTRDADSIHTTIQRLIVEEDGILLLCSDGLSDNGLVERSWETIAESVFEHKTALETAVQSWIEFANQHNGHDNVSLVMLYCQVSKDPAQLVKPTTSAPPATATPNSELSEASKALLYDDADEQAPEAIATEPAPEPQERYSRWAMGFGAIVLAIALGVAGLLIWQRVDPTGFQRTQDNLLEIFESEN
ncbi:protein phosphatase 2C domain-containing protein [Oculatella sp. LEGE 06141]|uniref:PP2C family protein-serine/threonine phosphatase n=1 Tax=Oculatella sp. LEGE 06141 TaxID=1828648 RepID=UPI001880BAA4|nr:protein phosphatase 2C domain-containing protein [Oculatella sp. LEGE 06141]MBE9177381.1 protein phosphatase 2C domain-containing protein [Oculatella sp. LEGE 06141]